MKSSRGLRAVAVISLSFWLLTALAADQSGDTATVVRLDIAPLNVEPDPGPEYVFGADKTKKSGKHFLLADVILSGDATAYRVYFDLLNDANFHYLDRVGQKVVLGISEAGLEQVLAQGSLPATPGRELRIARHGSDIGVFYNEALVLSVFDDRRRGGTVGVRALPGGGGTVKLDVRRREDVHFADDFMREEEDSYVWAKVNCGKGKGDFAIKSLRHPLLSANAFCYMGDGRNVMSVVGEPWWDNYRYDVSLRGPHSAKIGLLFAYRDERNYGLFRWKARRVNSDQSSIDRGYRELVLVSDGKETVLAESPGGYLPNQWYRASILVTYNRIRVSIDGHPLIEVNEPRLTSGGVGLWCDVPKRTMGRSRDPKAQPISMNSLHNLMLVHAVFDDVKVKSVQRITEDFRMPGPLGRGWRVGLGSWKVVQPSSEASTPWKGRGELHVSSPQGPAKSLIGNREWSHYQLACDVSPGAGSAGLVFLYRDESAHYMARIDARELQLVKIAGGEEKIIDRVGLTAGQSASGQGGFRRLRVRVKRGHILVDTSDGSAVETLETTGDLRGRVGLCVAPGASAAGTPARFRRFRLAFMNDPDPLVTSNAVFVHETQHMGNWTDPKSEWYPQNQKKDFHVDGQRIVPLWHRSQFPGDVELVVESREVLEERHELALAVSKNGQGSYNGYVFRYKAGLPGESGGNVSRLQLMRQGKVVKQKDLSPGAVRELSTVALRRAGKYLVGKVNGKPVIQYRDDRPLRGSKVAYYTKGVIGRPESSKILSRHFHNDFFAAAPCDWRLAGPAVFQITNRWQCDSRWTFACLENDRAKGKPAVLWSKKLYPGDVTVEFFVGNKMDGARGRPYKYARDINVTICSDGQDLTKGYTFMFGGQNNVASMIYRNGVEVKRTPDRIPVDMNFHRHWFTIRVQKRGDEVGFSVDNYFKSEPHRELSYKDPQPLVGDRVAIWTYNNAMMISRVRVSGEGGIEREHPDLDVRTLKTIYDRSKP